MHARRPAAGRPGRAGLPRQLLRGRRLRPLGRRAAADRGRVGGRRRGRAASTGNFLESGPLPSAPPAADGGRRACGSCSATSGSGRAAPTRPTPASARPPGALGEYNGKFMCNQIVLRGGSCATPRSHIRADLPQLLPARRALAVQRHPTGEGRMTHDDSPHVRDAQRRPAPRSAPRCSRGLRQPAEGAAVQVLLRRATARSCSSRSRELDEYYPTRTELAHHARARRARWPALLGPGCLLIEYGSGSSTQDARCCSTTCDGPAGVRAGRHLAASTCAQSAAALAARLPRRSRCCRSCADYTRRSSCPRRRSRPARRVVYFPGSTIGNFDPTRRAALPAATSPGWCGPGGGLLIGVDLKKDPRDAARRLQRRARASPRRSTSTCWRASTASWAATSTSTAFRHYAFYNPPSARIEMHLVSLRAATSARRVGEEFASPAARASRPRARTSTAWTTSRGWPARRDGPWSASGRMPARCSACTIWWRADERHSSLIVTDHAPALSNRCGRVVVAGSPHPHPSPRGERGGRSIILRAASCVDRNGDARNGIWKICIYGLGDAIV